MIDIRNKLDVFLITNGRSTFNYVKKSLDEQIGVKFNIHIHRDMKWLAANKRILKICKTPYFARIDDDMILNPHAINFMWHVANKSSSKIAMQSWRLWEPYSSKICKGVKIYTTEIAKNIGFRISKLGKIDKLFAKDAKSKGYHIESYTDIVAIHACSNYEEHLKYALMRGEDKGKDFKNEISWMKNKIGRFNVPLDMQRDMSVSTLSKKNKEYKTDFYRFIKNANKK